MYIIYNMTAPSAILVTITISLCVVILLYNNDEYLKYNIYIYISALIFLS